MSLALPGTPRCTWRPLHRTSQLWDLTTLGFLSDTSQTLLQAPSDFVIFCWCPVEADPAYPSSNRRCSYCCVICGLESGSGAPDQNRGASETGDVPEETLLMWISPYCIIFWRYVADCQTTYHHCARNRIQPKAFAVHLLIDVIPFCRYPVHSSDDDPSMVLFVGEMIEPIQSRMLIERDILDSSHLSTCNDRWKIQVVCHMLSPPHFALQLSTYQPSSLLNQGYMLDQASGVW